MSVIEYYNYDSWDDFKSNFINELFTDGIFHEGKYLFRGHRCPEWPLTPSYDRCQYPYNKFPALINLFKEECTWLNVDSNVIENEKYFIAFAQHYGIPTRLLDWTYSPYIAAFFAYSDLAKQEDIQGDIAIWVLNSNCEIWSADLGVEILKIPSFGNLRIRNQNGCFTLSNTPFKCLEEYAEYLSERCNRWPLRKCTIPSMEYLKAITDLNSMGINHSRIFPDLAGSAASSFLNWRCQYF